MAKLTRWQAPTAFPELLEWLDSPWMTLRPFAAGQMFRIEDYAEDGNYVIRAELPGLDPDKDIEVTVEDGALTIHAERHEEEKKAQRSEFRYGSLTRTVRLPGKAAADKVSAKYENGILSVTVPVPEGKPEGRHVAIDKAA